MSNSDFIVLNIIVVTFICDTNGLCTEKASNFSFFHNFHVFVNTKLSFYQNLYSWPKINIYQSTSKHKEIIQSIINIVLEGGQITFLWLTFVFQNVHLLDFKYTSSNNLQYCTATHSVMSLERLSASLVDGFAECHQCYAHFTPSFKSI